MFPGVRVLQNLQLLRVLVFTACLVTKVVPSEAQVVKPDGDPGRDRLSQFDIPAQPLREALLAYAKTTGYGVLVDDDVTAGRGP
jgi:hypothetical protein